MENLFEMSNVICRYWTFRWTSDWIKIWDLSVVSVTVTHRKISIDILKREFLQSTKIDTNFLFEHFFIEYFILILVRRSWSFEYYSCCRYKRQRIDLCVGRINFETIRISNWFLQVKFFLWKIKVLNNSSIAYDSSPHLVEARERIRINGDLISKEKFVHYFWRCYQSISDAVKQSKDDVNLSRRVSTFIFYSFSLPRILYLCHFTLLFLLRWCFMFLYMKKFVMCISRSISFWNWFVFFD